MRAVLLSAAVLAAAGLPAAARADGPAVVYVLPGQAPPEPDRLARVEADVATLKLRQAEQTSTSSAVLAELKGLRADLRADRPPAPQPKAEPAAPAATKAATASSCGCGLVGSTCPTPGFCGGAGCKCSSTAAAPGVAAAGPFVPGRSGTPATSAPSAGSASTSRPAPARSPGLISIGAPPGTSGTTSGCANGACAAPARAGLFRR